MASETAVQFGMLAPNSPLRSLPPGLDVKQNLALDGIRHAAEMVEIADTRLRQLLGDIALRDEGKPTHVEIASAFMDAWSMIDAIDRLRSLLQLMPEEGKRRPPAHVLAYFEATKSARVLRNVADHVFQRIEHIVAKKMPVLGRLQWVTAIPPRGARTCVLEPGSLYAGKKTLSFANVGGRSIRFPTGGVTLSAGEHECNLCDAYKATASMVSNVELSVDVLVRAHKLEGKFVGSDLFIRGDLGFQEDLELQRPVQG